MNNNKMLARLPLVLLKGLIMIISLNAYAEIDGLRISTLPAFADASELTIRSLPMAERIRFVTGRNETDSIQVTLTATRDMRVSFEMTPADGNPLALPSEHIRVYMRGPESEPDQKFVQINEISLVKDQSAPVWVTLTSPPEAKSGLYLGTFVLSSGHQEAKIPLDLSVYDFELPHKLALLAMNGLPDAFLRAVNSLPVESEGWESTLHDLDAHQQTLAAVWPDSALHLADGDDPSEQSVFVLKQEALRKLTQASDQLPAYTVVHSSGDINHFRFHESGTSVELFSARREQEHTQIAVELPASVESLTVRNRLDDPHITFTAYEILRVGDWDDVLRPVSQHVDAKNGVVKLWITYNTMAHARPGEYHDVIELTAGDTVLSVPVAITVNEFVIPLKKSIPLVMGIAQAMFDEMLDYADEEAKTQAMLEYLEMLLEHRMDPYFAVWLQRHEHEAYSSPWPMDDPRTEELFADPRFTKVALPFFSLNDEELGQMINRLKIQGLYDKAYFYLADEPYYFAHYEELEGHAERLHRFDLNANILTSFFCGPRDGPEETKDDLFSVFDLWRDHTRIFCMSAWALQMDESLAEKSINLLEEGQEWWTYTCMGPGGFQPNTLLDQRPIQNRAVMWRTWKEGSTGFLYWAVNSFRLDADGGFIFRPVLPEGDGLKIYPGEFFGTKGPLPSVRLKRWLDGIEDYEYLRAVEIIHGRETAEKLLEKVYQGPITYTASTDDIEAFKRKAVEYILE